MEKPKPDCSKCQGKGVIQGEMHGHNKQGFPLFVYYFCDCTLSAEQRSEGGGS